MNAILFAAVAAACPCKGNLWPASGETVPTDARIQVTMCGSVSEFAEKIVLGSPKLVAGKDEVPLQPGDTLSGPGEGKMVLMPERPLTPKAKYKLVFDPKVAKDLEKFGVPLGNATWTAGTATDEAAPAWAGTPSGTVKLDKANKPVAELKLPLKDAKGAQVQVELEEAGGVSGATEYQFVPAGGAVKIGGECSPLQLKHATKYHVTVSALDSAGNSKPAGGAVDFETPAEPPPAGLAPKP